MTVFFACMIIIVNFIVLNIFSGCILYFYHKKTKFAKDDLIAQFESEKRRMEELSHELINISEVLLERMDKKEQEFGLLIEQYKSQLAAVPAESKDQRCENAAFNKMVTTKTFTVETKKIDAEQFLTEDTKYKEIYYLADKGLSIVEIARKSHKTKGEINLILSLRKARAVGETLSKQGHAC